MGSYDQAKKFITVVHHACKSFRDVPVPVIARIHGFCLGAGLEIMAACDLRIATKDSTFAMREFTLHLKRDEHMLTPEQRRLRLGCHLSSKRPYFRV